MRKRWISLLLVFALVLAVWSVCAVAADAQKADEAADETTAAEPAAEEPVAEETPAGDCIRSRRRSDAPPRTQKHPQKTANRTIFTL